MSKPKHPQATSHRLTPAELADRIQHSNNAAIRKRSIHLLEKYLRREDRFHDTWAALGGAQGIATLMSELSVTDVRYLCSRLGRTASAQNARAERRSGLQELIDILMTGKTDTRPLRRFYQSIVPASHDEVVDSWEARGPVEWTPLQKSCLFLGHREQYQQRFLRDIFPKKPRFSCGFRDHVMLFRGNLAFSETILNHLISRDSDSVDIPNHFLPNFAMPLLQKLSNRRTSVKPEFDKFLALVVQCVKQHPESLKSGLSLNTSSWRFMASNPLALIIELWAQKHVRGEDRSELESHLQILLQIHSDSRLTMGDVYPDTASIRSKSDSRLEQMRWDLLCLVLKNLQSFNLDPESETGSEDVDKRWAATNAWPVHIFMELPVDNALALLKRLDRLHPSESFLQCPASGDSILMHKPTPSSGRKTDVDIARTMLHSKMDPSGSSWLAGVRSLVQARIKKATEAKEPRIRGFWAKSALKLCVAARNMTMVHETFLWARRFVKDPLIGHEIHDDLIQAPELITLLSALPDVVKYETEEFVDDAVATARRNMAIANQIIIELFHTAISAIREPSFKAGHWSRILRLPQIVVTRRTDRSEVIRRTIINKLGREDPQWIFAEVIWKPTAALFLDVEALLSDPAASKLSKHATSFPAGPYIYGLEMDPQLRVEMTNFYLQNMNEKLPESLVTSHIGSIVSAVSRLTYSSQPELAIPFIRPIIQNSKDSSSHREIFRNSFLESLSARHAREFLQSTADTMVEMMREQNQRAWKEGEQPVIKVTTVKMIANVLDGSLVVDAETSCKTLVALLKEARHMDARIAIITGLLSTLEESTSTPTLRKYILDVFEESVLPMASQLNERRPTTVEEWEGAEMPEVSQESSILKLLIDKTSSNDLRSEDRTRLVKLIMDALLASAAENQRWMKLFAEKHGFTLSTDDIVSMGPAHHKLLDLTVSLEFDAVPLPLLTIFCALILQNVGPSTNIAQITKAVKKDADLRASDAGKHWLTQYDNPDKGVFTRLGLSTVLRLLQRGRTTLDSKDRIGELRKLVADVADRWMREGKPDMVYELVNWLMAEPKSEKYSSVDWRENGIKVLEDIIRVAEALQAEKGHAAKSANTFRLRVSVLRLSQGVGGDALTAYSEMVSDLVDRLTARRGPYHNDFDLLKAEVVRQATSSKSHCFDAVALARLHERDLESAEPDLGAYLRFELVAVGLKNTEVPKDGQAGVKKVVRKWRECRAEELRAMGEEVDGILRKRKDWGGEEGV
ncbi:hypothetical protein LIA77_10754 [Sarocladium implicatum]|nr:hypothetical protein LIA77_10754 [Sarocladium implicatum]